MAAENAHGVQNRLKKSHHGKGGTLTSKKGNDEKDQSAVVVDILSSTFVLDHDV